LALGETLNPMTARRNMPLLQREERKLVLEYLGKAYPPRPPSRQGSRQTRLHPARAHSAIAETRSLFVGDGKSYTMRDAGAAHAP
jgi:hypothetical protein